MTKYRISKQKGAAFILLTLLIIPLAGMVQMSIEGSRLIQENNRLSDGIEAATMAVSLANQGNSVRSKTLAKDYIDSYLLSINTRLDSVSVSYQQGKENYQGSMTDFYQYEVTASGKFQPWFNILSSSDDATTLSNLGRSAMTKTYQSLELTGQDLDLVFVSDFSGSMTEQWNNWIWWDRRTKIDILKEQINLISEELIDNSTRNNRIGFVPYAIRTQELINGELRCSTQLHYQDIDGVKYQDINWYRWGNEKYLSIRKCAMYGESYGFNNKNYCPFYSTQAQAKAAEKVLRNSTRSLLDGEDYVDIQKTVNSWLEDQTQKEQLHPKFGFYSRSSEIGDVCASHNFRTLLLDNKKPSINKLKAGGGTSVYQGLIRGAQLLDMGKPADDASEKEATGYGNRAKMLLILSDGKEDPYTHTFKKLVNAGLCEKFRDHFMTVPGKTDLYIGVIGIKYSASSADAFRRCADDVIDVTNSEDLLESIRNLIAKGVSKKNQITRFYDKSLEN